MQILGYETSKAPLENRRIQQFARILVDVPSTREDKSKRKKINLKIQEVEKSVEIRKSQFKNPSELKDTQADCVF